MRAPLRVLVPLLFLGGCMLGASKSSYAPAKGPAGAMVSLDLGGDRRFEGELLAVEHTTLLVLQAQQPVRIALPLIRSGKAPKVSFTGRSLTGDVRERLRLISRFPQGVSPELEARLLQAYGARSVREVS